MTTAARVAGGGVVDVPTPRQCPGARGKDALPSDWTD